MITYLFLLYLPLTLSFMADTSSPSLDSSDNSPKQTESMATQNNQATDGPSASLESKTPIQDTINEADEEDKSDDTNKQRQIELEEERKLKAKHPCIQRPGSEFLQKRLQRGQKYFDSGDYNMAKASTNPNIKLPDSITPIPTKDSKILNKRH